MANARLITRILRSVFFKRSARGAAHYARNSSSLFTLIGDVLNKSGGLSGASFTAFREQLGIVTRLLKAYASKEYRQVPWKTLIRIIAVLIYFVSPLDFLPDFLPIIGLTDDIALTLWLFSSIKDDLAAFQQWEATRKGTPANAGGQPETIRIG